MSLKDMIDRIVSARLESALKDFMGDDESESNGDANGNGTTVDAPKRPIVRRGRLGNGPRVAYVLTDKAKRHMSDRKWDPTSVMFNTQAQTFAAVAKVKRPITAKELEGLTGLVRKTIESTVYHLRQDGWIESVSIQPQTAIERSEPEDVTPNTEAQAAEFLKGMSPAERHKWLRDAGLERKRRTARKAANAAGRKR